MEESCEQVGLIDLTASTKWNVVNSSTWIKLAAPFRVPGQLAEASICGPCSLRPRLPRLTPDSSTHHVAMAITHPPFSARVELLSRTISLSVSKHVLGNAASVALPCSELLGLGSDKYH